jgi:predicted DNA-binding ArsR family transcriptional regulator
MIKKISIDLMDEKGEGVMPSKSRDISEASFFNSMKVTFNAINDVIEQINKELELLREENRELRETIEDNQFRFAGIAKEDL